MECLLSFFNPYQLHGLWCCNRFNPTNTCGLKRFSVPPSFSLCLRRGVNHLSPHRNRIECWKMFIFTDVNTKARRSLCFCGKCPPIQFKCYILRPNITEQNSPTVDIFKYQFREANDENKPFVMTLKAHQRANHSQHLKRGGWIPILSSQGWEGRSCGGAKLVRYASASIWPNLTWASVVRWRLSSLSGRPLASMHTTFGRLILNCASLTFSMYLSSPDAIATCIIYSILISTQHDEPNWLSPK